MLVGVVGTLLVVVTLSVLRQAYFLWGTDRVEELIDIAKIVGISVAFACLVLAGVRVAATVPAAALFGGMICAHSGEWDCILADTL